MGRSLLIIFAILGFTFALNQRDIDLIAELKQSAEAIENEVMLKRLEVAKILSESVVITQIAPRAKIEAFQNLSRRAETMINSGKATEEDVQNIMKVFLLIVDTNELTDKQYGSRVLLYTNGASEQITKRGFQNELSLFRNLLSQSSRKIAQLSESAKETENQLVTAFNNFAYAGMLPQEEYFLRYIEICNQY